MRGGAPGQRDRERNGICGVFGRQTLVACGPAAPDLRPPAGVDAVGAARSGLGRAAGDGAAGDQVEADRHAEAPEPRGPDRGRGRRRGDGDPAGRRAGRVGGLARKCGGRFNLRFDDTNPTKEEQEYVDAIKEDVRWLGAEWEPSSPNGGGLYFASDYFGQMFEFAEELIRKGMAYVDDLSAEE